MGALRCVDGSSLLVRPVPTLDRGGQPFEVKLELRRNGRLFGAVGQGCSFFLGRAAQRLAEARDEQEWPDPDGRFPEGELFAFAKDDRCGHGGELRCVVRTTSEWVSQGDLFATGHWRVARRAVIEAWGRNGCGVRAVLTSRELEGFLREVLEEAGKATD